MIATGRVVRLAEGILDDTCPVIVLSLQVLNMTFAQLTLEMTTENSNNQPLDLSMKRLTVDTVKDVENSISKFNNFPVSTNFGHLFSSAKPLLPTSVTQVDFEKWKDIDRFAFEFKQKRISLGYTQGEVGRILGNLYGNDFSQTTISRFEALNLSLSNMEKLKPLLQLWLKYVKPNHSPEQHSSNLKHSSVNQSDMESKSDRKIQKRKRRSSLSGAQRTVLESHFWNNSRPNSIQIAKLAAKLNLEINVVRVWFCNR